MLIKSAIFLAKASTSLIKFLNLGRASSMPGKLALKISPNIIKFFSQAIDIYRSKKRFFITGTNGKSTSTGLLKAICEQEDTEVICNDFGANLVYGVCTCLIENYSFEATMPKDFVIEIDEASLRQVSVDLKTEIIAVTNLFRDQLDRYGEINTTRDLIAEGINKAVKLNPNLTVVLNIDDNKLAAMDEMLDAKNFFYYTVKKLHSIDDSLEEEVNLSRSFLNKPDLELELIEENIGSSNLRVKYQQQSFLLRLNLPGLYNAYNAATAIACAIAAGIDIETIRNGIETYSTKFGRSEKKLIQSKEYQIFLIKNPRGTSEVLRYLKNDRMAEFTFVINDDYADGRDVSWLWDANFEYITDLYQSNPERKAICSGRRAHDMALRLKYAGLNEKQIIIEPKLEKALKASSTEMNNYLLPSYTALLDIEKNR